MEKLRSRLQQARDRDADANGLRSGRPIWQPLCQCQVGGLAVAAGTDDERSFAGRLLLSCLNPQITFSRTDMKRITFVKSKVSAVAPGRMQFEIGTAVEQTSNKEPGLYGSAPANAASQLTRYTEVRTCNDF